MSEITDRTRRVLRASGEAVAEAVDSLLCQLINLGWDTDSAIKAAISAAQGFAGNVSE